MIGRSSISFESRMMTTSLPLPDAFLSPLEIRCGRDPRARRGPRPRRDVTSIATIRKISRPAPSWLRGGRCDLGVAAGRRCFQKLAPRSDRAARPRWGQRRWQDRTDDGDRPARAVLSAERWRSLPRTPLRRATATHEFVRRIAGSRTRFLLHAQDHAGCAPMEKYAVRCGGGSTTASVSTTRS